jgi:integrase
MAGAHGRTAAPAQGDSPQRHEQGGRGPAATGYPGLPEAYHAFHTSLIAKSSRTAENYAAALRRFDEFLRDTARTPEVMTTDQIDGRTLEAFYVWLLEQRGRAAKRTAITYVAGVRAFLAFLDRNGWLAPDVSYERMKAALRALIGRVPYPTPRIDEAIAHVITYVNELPLPPATPRTRQARLTLLRDRAILTTLYGTALRRAELASLNRADIQDGRAGEAIITGKGSKERIVFFDAESLAAIRAYLQERNDSYRPLFIRHDDGRGDPERGGENYRLSGHYIWVTVKRYGRLAGVTLTTHHLRHLRARVMLNNGMSLSLLQDLLGHASPETTKRIYAQHSRAHLREAVAQFGTPAAEIVRRVQAQPDEPDG